jgi:hypothetical protein
VVVHTVSDGEFFVDVSDVSKNKIYFGEKKNAVSNTTPILSTKNPLFPRSLYLGPFRNNLNTNIYLLYYSLFEKKCSLNFINEESDTIKKSPDVSFTPISLLKNKTHLIRIDVTNNCYFFFLVVYFSFY